MNIHLPLIQALIFCCPKVYLSYKQQFEWLGKDSLKALSQLTQKRNYNLGREREKLFL